MLGRGLLLATLGACAPSTDLTVAPAATPPPTSAPVEVPAPLESGRLPAWARPIAYRVDLAIDPAAEHFSGKVVIDVQLDRPTRTIVLHAAGLDIERAEVMVAEHAIPAVATARLPAGAAVRGRHGADELVLTTAEAVGAGEARIEISYRAPLDDRLRGLYRVAHADKHYVFTQLEPADARRMLPCFDEPAHKTPFLLSVTLPSGNLAFSNAPEIARTALPGDRVRYEFAATKPIPSYLLALAAGPLEVREGTTQPVPVRLVATAGKTRMGDFVLAAAAEQLPLFAEALGRSYPYPKLDLVAVPRFGPGAMENAGLITFREEILLLDPLTAPVAARRQAARTMAHELAHQWLGNLVTMRWWDDLWLNEGFASFFEVQIVDAWRPDTNAGLGRLAGTGWVMDFDALEAARCVRQPVNSVYEAEEAFDAITYVKGAAVIEMLAHWLGEDGFRQGMQLFLRRHAWSNASAEDAFAALSEATGQDVAAVATTFLDQPGVPLVRATLSCPSGQAPRLDLSQQRYRGSKRIGAVASDPLWRIPICVAVGRKRGQSEPVCTVLAERASAIELPAGDCPDWVAPNAGYHGYYRFALPMADLHALGRASSSRDARARIGSLTNLWALVQAGEAPAVELIETLATLKSERRREVVDLLIELLERMSDALVTDDARPAFRRYVAALLLPMAKRLGFDGRPEDDEDTRLLRGSVLAALAVHADDPWVRREGCERARRFMAAPGSVDPDTAAVALRVAARAGEEAVAFERVRERLRQAAAPAARIQLLAALGSYADPAAVERALDLGLDGTVPGPDLPYLVRAALSWPESRTVFFAWLERNLETLASQSSGGAQARMIATLRRICDPEAHRRAAAVFGPLVERIDGSDRRLREALQASELCIDLRARQAEAASARLRAGRW